ncbi:putative membrane protein YeaQ/YmgE (transglycosylase-associated protein family) [Sphingomonas kaistensis]|uniref:Putative membrane protein YeaQ/YmgE (Transglycosylase-associated protein family) n=1 Tax=Sphingomonas kaistensis TaxID=298708 RepID=A0A7X6BIB1_9SPHN|nr:glycine zipper 2TM domain-containing protein [Sphingomonas kaistensis]NJC06966.1 putative membrane protein YeaQ/YmgE (transglycosylase-associated protein family) [Sphingomonas kaistensis]
MVNKFIIAAAAASLVAIPGAASAQYYPGYGGYNGGYSNTYQRGYNGYNNYQRGYNGQTYYGNRCSGTTGTIVGGVAGAVVGSQIAGGRRSYDYYGNRRGGSGATGAIIGGAVGALLGRKVDKDSCNRRNNNYGYRY